MVVKKIIKALFLDGKIVTENSDEARALNDKNVFGTKKKDNKIEPHTKRLVN